MTATSAVGVYRRETESGDVVYYIKYMSGGRQKLEKIGARSQGIRIENAKAIRARRTLMKEAASGGSITFGEIARDYFEDREGLRSIKQDKAIYKVSFSRLEKTKVKDIRENDIKTIIENKEKEGRAISTINHYKTLIKAIFNHAAKKRIISVNPAAFLKKQKTNNDRQGYLNQTECAELLSAIEKDGEKTLYLFVLLAIATGARVGTILNIRGVDCDMKNGVLTLKNLKADRVYTAHIGEGLKEVLTPFITDLKNQYGYIIGGGEKPQNNGTQPKKLQPYLDRLFNNPRGIKKDDRINKITAHSLRHSFGTNLAGAGKSALLIMRLMDHADIRQTARYAKIAEQVKKEAADQLLNEVLGAKKPLNS